VTDLGAHGISVSLPTGWEGRIFRRPEAGDVAAAAADGPPAPPGETTYAVMHVSTIALPADVGDFASNAVDQLGPNDALIVLFEYGPDSASQPLFAATGLPTRLSPTDYGPNVLQRNIRGQAGVQRFFNEEGRAFCLYVVLGSFVNRRALVASVNRVLSTLTIGSATAATAPSTTTAAPPASTSTTSPPTTAPATTAPGPSSTTTTAPPASGPR